MADEHVSQTFSENPDPQEKGGSGDDKTPSQVQLHPQLGVRLPDPLIERLARINRHYLVLDQEKTQDTS